MDEQPKTPVVVVQTDTSGRIIDAAKTFAGLTPQAMQNLILIALAVVVGLLIWLERADRRESMTREREDRVDQIQMILRSGESQGELNRQAILTLASQVGKLESVVNNLDRTVNALPRIVGKSGPGEDGEVSAPMPRIKGSQPTPKTS